MATIVVIMAVMAIMLTVAVQSVTFQQRREKEEELIFRGNQAIEAIRLFRARNGRFPITLEELAQAKPRVLRKVWKDPITGKADWVPIFLGQGGQVIAGGGGASPAALFPTPTPAPGLAQPGTASVGPIVGVHSRSCDDSIKLYQGRTRYCDWKFVFDPQNPLGGGGNVTPLGPQTPTPGPVAPTRPVGD